MDGPKQDNHVTLPILRRVPVQVVDYFETGEIHDVLVMPDASAGTPGSNAYAKRLLESQSRAHLLED